MIHATDQRSRGQRLAPLIIIVSIVIPSLVRERFAVADLWPAWRPVLADLCQVLAATLAIASVAFGIKTWRDTGGVR